MPILAATPTPLDISQFPSVYAQKGISPNLFLLLDDSGSMQFEYLGERGNISGYYYGFPPGSSHTYGDSTYGRTDAPGFAANDDDAAEYRSAYVNPNYYDPSVTYTPWACAAPYPESEAQLATSPASIINPITNATGADGCQWDDGIDIWVMHDADVNKAYLNPARVDAGWRSINVWNDSNDNDNDTPNNGYVGNSGRSGGECSDGDVNGNPIIVCPGATVHGDLDDNYDSNFTLVSGSGPNHGTVNIEYDGDFSYTADAGYTGSDSFQYQYQHCSYWHGWRCDTRTDTLEIEVANDIPAGLWPATYFNYFGDRPGSNNDYENTDNYQRVQICPVTATTNSHGIVSTDVCQAPPLLEGSGQPYHSYTDASGNYVYVQGDGTKIVRTPQEALQNFANWYQYYRSHILLANAGVGIAFMQLTNGFRVDYGVINTMDGNKDGAQIEATEDFTSALRLNFLQKLYGQKIPYGVGTPNRLALKHVGEWFGETAEPGVAPWGNSATETTVAGTAPLSCRANYVILATDGEWNGNSPDVGNQDHYEGRPYEDRYSDTLADVAMKYWKEDLQSKLDDTVPTNGGDNANWQHLVTFTVGLGVLPSLVQDYMAKHSGVDQKTAQEAVFDRLKSGTEDWPRAYSHQIDDTWHAAVDGHGTYASADNPSELYQAINAALETIKRDSGAASSVAVNTEKTGQTRSRQQVYQALFHPKNGWWGDVLALPVLTQAVQVAPGSSTTRNVVTVSNDADWSTSCVLTGGECQQMAQSSDNPPVVTAQSPSARTILTTWDGSARAFTPTLPAVALSAIGGKDVVNYIRGVRSTEVGHGGVLRARTSVMGDVVRSSPVYVGKPNKQYPNIWANLLYPTKTPPENGGETYSAFIQTYQNRKPAVYVGANDGMLHAFYAPSARSATGGGREMMAYVPQAVYKNLSKYAGQDYTHHYFVNATPGTGDLYYNGSWQTWLVGGEGAGGRSIFALKITDPDFSETSPGATVMGEWGPDDIGLHCPNNPDCGTDLGLTFGTPVIARFNNGKWGFVFGNGFNSTSGTAAIYIGIVQGDSNVKFYELKTGIQPSDDPLDQNRPDGIAFVTAVDLNGDHTTDYVYAGDYFGNVWRFNLTSQYEADWMNSTPKLLFQARNADGSPQPITTKLLVLAVPGAGSGYRIMVTFGTGASVTKTQQAPITTKAGVQSLYGVWDWHFEDWNAGAPSPGMQVTMPSAFKYESLAGGPSGGITRSTMQQQKVTDEQITIPGTGAAINNRVISQNQVCWAGQTDCSLSKQYGWYLDLVSSVQGRQGEKVVFNPVLRSGVFLVNTTIPSSSSGLTCNAAPQTGWTMAINPASGGRLPFEVFDTMRNGKFESITIQDENGKTVKVNTSGISLGAVGSPSFVTYNGDTWMVVNRGGGTPTAQQVDLGGGIVATQLSWKELR